MANTKKQTPKKKVEKVKKFSLPSDIEMDRKILTIMDKNLKAGRASENLEGIICNKFATSAKIIQYIKKITNNN